MDLTELETHDNSRSSEKHVRLAKPRQQLHLLCLPRSSKAKGHANVNVYTYVLAGVFSPALQICQYSPRSREFQFPIDTFGAPVQPGPQSTKPVCL